MKTNWQTKNLKEICLVFADGDWVESKDQSVSGIRLIQTGNVGNLVYLGKEARSKYISEETFSRLNCTEIFPGDILVSRLPEPVGRACIIPETNERMITAVDCTIIRPDESIVDKKYLLYFTFSSEYQLEINKNLSGTTRQRISRSALGNIEVPLPPLATQQKIVARLDELLGNITQAKRLRQEAIVDTEKILYQTLREIFEEGKEKGWEEKTLEEVAPIKRETNKKLLPYVGMEDVESATGKFLGSLESRKVKSNTFYFDNTCVLYGRLRPYLNKVLIPDFEGHCSTEMFPLAPKKDILLKQYLFYWITQNSFINDAMRTAGGARMPRANMKEVMKFKMLIPPLPEQHEIVTRLDTLSAHLRELRQLQSEQLDDLKKLEKAYLREAFNGELC